MPAPVLKPEDVTALVEQAVFLQRTAQPEIEFEFRFAERPLALRCDARLVGQAVINIVKNAIESIEARIVERGNNPPGQIRVAVGERDGQLLIVVEDNGKGLPQDGRERLTEPYVTTRSKGTGLGLAIVKKIMEDHQGELVLEDREEGGARVWLMFPSDARALVRPETPDRSAELSSITHGA
jgi:two-component system nitrogen regulation sensor histidine kinase NtrY